MRSFRGFPCQFDVNERGCFLRVVVPDVVRRELEMPLQFSGLRIQRDDRIRVEVVAFAIVAVEIRRRIAGRPIEGVELRIVGACQPRGRSRVRDAASLPRFRSRLAWRRHRPEAPHFFARCLIECGEKAAHAFVTAGRAGNHEVPDDERRAGGVVVLAPVRHFGFPEQRAGGRD